MTDELLPYYERELTYLRSQAALFADAHPKIASRLRLSPGSTGDPHVERLIEAVAYLNARIRFKLDDDFPELTHALLGVLYPHYLAPVPSTAIVRFELDRSQGELTSGYELPRETVVETDPIDGSPCRFQTCYPVTLWPFGLRSAQMSGPPFRAPATPVSSEAAAVVRLELACFSEEVPFSQMNCRSLRFFLNGLAQHTFPLYELLFNNVVGVALADSPADRDPVLLDPGCLGQVGYETDEGLLPYSPRSFVGYRLLTEYFTFPEKFLFFDLNGLDAQTLAKFGNRLEVYIYLNRTLPDLERHVTESTFQMGCTPIVNLFRQRAEPIRLTHTDTQYRVVPDARRPLATEVYSIERVSASSPDGEEEEFLPFFSSKHALSRHQETKFWYATRTASLTDDALDRGTEVFLSLVDLDFSPAAPADWTLDVETICLNRDLPHRLPFGGGQPRLELSIGGPVATIQCLTAPTRTYRPPLRHAALWRLVSHLSLNHLSLSDNEFGAESLREILKLYDFTDSDETRSIIEGVQNVATRRVVGRAGHGISGGLCRGLEVKIHFDEQRYTGSGVYLFASVLERFLGLYCSINSFTKLVATTSQREGVLRRWPPRTGEKTLL